MKLNHALLYSSLALPLLGCPSDPEPGPDSSSTGSESSTGPGTSSTTVDPSSTSTAAEESTSSTTAMADSGTGTTAATAGEESSGTTGPGDALPDIDMTVVADDTMASIYTQTLTFTEQSCQFVDGCLGGVGQRRLLRFSTITPNPVHHSTDTTERNP